MTDICIQQIHGFLNIIFHTYAIFISTILDYDWFNASYLIPILLDIFWYKLQWKIYSKCNALL